MIRSIFACSFREYAFPSHLVARFFSTTDRISKLCYPLIKDLEQIDSTVILPHLKQKTDWLSTNIKDTEWTQKDLVILSKIKDFVEANDNFSDLKLNLIGLFEGLTVHVKHRVDIVYHNKDIMGGRFPENGALIRALYVYADQNLIFSSIANLKERKILEAKELYTEAYLSAELRRLIRKVLRIAGSIQTANVSAIMSLVDSACLFPERDRKILEQINVEAYRLAKEICDKERSSKNKQEDLRTELNSILNKSLAAFFQDRAKTTPELLRWAENNSFGLSFNELQQKYLGQNHSSEQVLKKIIGNSEKTNSLVNAITHSKSTNVTQAYIDELEKVSPWLLPALGATNGSRKKFYNVVLKRNYATTSAAKKSLEIVFEKKILKEPIAWQAYGLFGLKVNLDDNVTAELFPAAEDHNTSIKISDGKNSIYRKIPEYWLENWSVKTEKD